MKLLKTVLAVAAVFFMVWLILPTQMVTSDEAQTEDEFMRRILVEAAIPGMAIARIEGGQVTLLRGYGFADVEAGTQVTEETLFNIASISKPIMGLVLLQLVDRGLLDLDRDINDYLPFRIDNPHLEGEVITVRHLATHSAGIDDYYDVDSYAINRDPDVTLEQHVRSLLTAEGDRYEEGRYFLPYLPGTQRQYSNLSAGVAGLLVEATTGISLADYSRQTLFKVLNLEHTRWRLKGLRLESIAVPYEVVQCVPFTSLCADTESPKANFLISKLFSPPIEHKTYRPYPHFGNPQYPDGGIRTSIRELATLLTGILRNEDANGEALLTEQSYGELFSLQLPATVSEKQRFFWRDRNGLTGHMGSDLGVFASAYFDLETRDGFIVLMNRGVDAIAAGAMQQIATRLQTGSAAIP